MVDKVYAGPNMAVGEVQALKKLKINNPKNIFLPFINNYPILIKIQLKLEFTSLFYSIN